MCDDTLKRGYHSELLAQAALLSAGWDVSVPSTPKPYDMVAERPATGERMYVQVKTARRRSDRNGEIVVYAKKNSGKIYTLDDCTHFITVLDTDVYLFENREISEYWSAADAVDSKWERLSIAMGGTSV